jgi:hypothetical protein
MHERERHGVECDVDSDRVGDYGVGVIRDGTLVERVDLRHAGCIADVVRYLLEPGPRPPGEVDPGAGVRKRTRNGAADRPAAAVDRRGLVLQHHLDLLDRGVNASLGDADTTTSRKWSRQLRRCRGSAAADAEVDVDSRRRDPGATV